MAKWIIYFTFLFIVIGIGLFIKNSVNTNKIKPNKITRLFYNDDESFVSYWKETEKKGFIRYTIKNIIISTVIMGITGIFFILIKRSMFGYELNQTWIVAISMGIFLGLMDSIIWWIANQVRERRIEEKTKIERENINKGD